MSAIRDKIIETASELFYQQGYNLTGINQIIAQSGIAKATLYSHFKSKEDLCVAYIRFMNDRFLEELTVFCKSKRAGKGQITAIFDFLEKFFHSDGFNGCWCVNTVTQLPNNDTKIRTEIISQKNRFKSEIASLVKSNIACTPKQLEKTTNQLYLLYEGAIAESHLHQNAWPILTAKEMLKSIL